MIRFFVGLNQTNLHFLFKWSTLHTELIESLPQTLILLSYSLQSVTSNILNLKYQRFTISGWKDLGIRKSKFLEKNPFLYCNLFYMIFKFGRLFQVGRSAIGGEDLTASPFPVKNTMPKLLTLQNYITVNDGNYVLNIVLIVLPTRKILFFQSCNGLINSFNPFLKCLANKFSR